MNQINKSMQCQVVVVGDAKVGKSAIIRRITQDKFSEVRSFLIDFNNFEVNLNHKNSFDIVKCLEVCFSFVDYRGSPQFLISEFVFSAIS